VSDSAIDRVVEVLRRARAVTALTGAGVSAESGIPTFREAQTGLWARYRPEELASPEAFARWPDRVWQWYAWRRGLVAAARPNPAHEALAAMERRLPAFTLVTQNVDGLHQRAGSGRVLELHGNIMRTKCSREGRIIEGDTERGEIPPRCPACEAPLRPDVVWFGEMLPADTLRQSAEAADTCDVFLAIGTSGVVHPAASLPIVAHRAGADVVVINPDDDIPLLAIDGVTHLRGTAASTLPVIVEALGS